MRRSDPRTTTPAHPRARLRRAAWGVAALAALLTASGCNLLEGSAYAPYAEFTPAALTFQAERAMDDEQTPIQSVEFTTPAGAQGAYLTGYTVTYRDADGEPLAFGDGVAAFAVEDVGLRLPPGRTCPEGGCAPGEVTYEEATSELLELLAMPKGVIGAYLSSGQDVGSVRYVWTIRLDGDGSEITRTATAPVVVDRTVDLNPVVEILNLENGETVAPDHAFTIRVTTRGGAALETLQAALSGQRIAFPDPTSTTDVVLDEAFPVVSLTDHLLTVTATDDLNGVGTNFRNFTVVPSPTDATP